ncbi:hypothetical protein B1R94_27410 [Mycolicibacterium litorale]|nr:hypothetical protein B1R94_27410 [Mycolicibacterium litorale]
MALSCRECTAGLAHCHGTLIRHWRHGAECTEEGCESSEVVLHTLTIDCDMVGCDCSQQTVSRLAV